MASTMFLATPPKDVFTIPGVEVFAIEILFRLCVRTVTISERIGRQQLVVDLLEQAFNGRVYAAEGTGRHVKIKFWDLDGRGAGLEHISVQVCGILAADGQRMYSAFVRNGAASLDLV